MAGATGTVNAYGPPDGPLAAQERYCSRPDRGQRVIYHVRSVCLGTGGWSCLTCAASTEDRHVSA